MTNIQLNIQAQAEGKQIIAYEIDSNTKNLIENNSFKDKAMSCIEFIENNSSTTTLLSHGIDISSMRRDYYKCTYKINEGASQTFYPIRVQLNRKELDELNSDNYLSCYDNHLKTYNRDLWPTDETHQKDINLSSIVWNNLVCADDNLGENFYHTPGLNKSIANNNTVVFEIVSYTNGNLSTSFKVDDGFKLSELILINDDVDVWDSESEIAWLYYRKVFHKLYSNSARESGVTAFDENSTRAVEYKKSRYDFDLSFLGPTEVSYMAFEKSENYWSPSNNLIEILAKD